MFKCVYSARFGLASFGVFVLIASVVVLNVSLGGRGTMLSKVVRFCISNLIQGYHAQVPASLALLVARMLSSLVLERGLTTIQMAQPLPTTPVLAFV